MNEEKKLTDEEIVKALEHCLNGDYKTKCKDCPYDNSENYCQAMDRDVLDLIHRLQNEVSQWKSKAEHIEEVYDADREHFIKTTTEQKAEIERLTELYDETNSELFDRNIELENCEKSNKSLQTMNFNLSKEKAELQKQVDELKARDMSEMRDLFNNETDRLIEKAHQQGVKDTAKEILDEVSKHFGGRWLVELYKKYGLDWSVEVE